MTTASNTLRQQPLPGKEKTPSIPVATKDTKAPISISTPKQDVKTISTDAKKASATKTQESSATKKSGTGALIGTTESIPAGKATTGSVAKSTADKKPAESKSIVEKSVANPKVPSSKILAKQLTKSIQSKDAEIATTQKALN